MPTSRASAVWEGKLKDGRGSFKAGSGAFSGPYTFATRFEGAKGTNPEELIAAAHAASPRRSREGLHRRPPAVAGRVHGRAAESLGGAAAGGGAEAAEPRAEAGAGGATAVTPPRARDVAGLVIAVALAAGCVRLGVWQLDRLQQRRTRNAQLRAARERPAVEARAGLTADSAANRRVHAAGRYDYAHQRLWRAGTYEGVPGVALVTPLRLADGSAGFGERGGAPSPGAGALGGHGYRDPKK